MKHKINLQLFVDYKRIDDVDSDFFEVDEEHRLQAKEGHFFRTATITSAAAATPVSLLSDLVVPDGKKVYLEGFIAKVNGATLWATTANVKIQDTNGTPVDFVTMLVAALTGNATVVPGTANVTLENAYALGTGGTLSKGLQLLGNANGTGSDLVVSVWGVIK